MTQVVAVIKEYICTALDIKTMGRIISYSAYLAGPEYHVGSTLHYGVGLEQSAFVSIIEIIFDLKLTAITAQVRRVGFACCISSVGIGEVKVEHSTPHWYYRAALYVYICASLVIERITVEALYIGEIESPVHSLRAVEREQTAGIIVCSAVCDLAVCKCDLGEHMPGWKSFDYLIAGIERARYEL